MCKTLSEWIEASQKADKAYYERMQAEEMQKAKELVGSQKPPQNQDVE